MSVSALLDYLRRELMPTPGRGAAALRLTLACLAATIPIMTHHIPHGMVVMIVMYLCTVEDKVATVLATVLGAAGATVGLAAGLLVWEISLDLPWLRVCFFALFLFGGLFLKRIIAIPGLGSAIGLPAALVVVLPDVMVVPGIFSPSPETLVDFLLWIWVCMAVGLSVNLGVQLLIWRSDPLTLLEKEIDMRLRVVEETVLEIAGEPGRLEAAPAPSLASLATGGMSGPLALLKTACLKHAWARERREELAAIITLVDRLVTDAAVLRALPAEAAARAALMRVADACASTRRAFAERRLPSPPESPAAAEDRSASPPPLRDMETALDGIARVVRVASRAERPEGIMSTLLVPDAFANPEYIRFAIKGSLAALICYALFIGFDYRGIYTSIITCFVVSLSTIGASNQKGLLRFGGAAVGGGMGIFALVYLLPNVESVGGFWLVFGAGTMVAAWINFGTPRLSYGGYQTGLAFYKAVLHDVGMSLNLTVVRDRLVGVALGLVVFGMVEHFLWPVRAADRMRERLADVLRSLAGLAQACAGMERTGGTDLDERRHLISQQVANVQGFIESSKFEPGDQSPEKMERLLGDAQTVFLVLLAIARHEGDGGTGTPGAGMKEAQRLNAEIAAALAAAAERVQRGEAPQPVEIGGAMTAVEGAFSARMGPDKEANGAYQAQLSLYRELAAAVTRVGAVS